MMSAGNDKFDADATPAFSWADAAVEGSGADSSVVDALRLHCAIQGIDPFAMNWARVCNRLIIATMCSSMLWALAYCVAQTDGKRFSCSELQSPTPSALRRT